MIQNRFYPVYTDGSYSSNHPGVYAWAFVVRDNQGIVYEACGARQGQAATMRNVAGELAAAMRAVKWAVQKGIKIKIYHDYEGVGNLVTGKWKAKNPFTKAYVEYMRQHRHAIAGFVHVRGHSGVLSNDRADTLAKKALLGYELSKKCKTPRNAISC